MDLRLYALIMKKIKSGGGGKDGKDGTTFTPTVSEDGELSWKNNGDLPNPSPVNIKGKNGITFTPSVSDDGELSWSNDGEMPNPKSIVIKGKDGKDGLDGRSVTNISIDTKHHLICQMSDETEIDAGLLVVLPDVTEADNGKILKVVDGKWTLSTDSNDDDVSVLKVNETDA